MKVPLSWLKDYININISSTELANRLTMAGIEVGAMQVIGGNWDRVVVGEITAIARHPNAERLSLVTVDLGTEQRTVVAGATNMQIGDRIAFAYPGAELVDGHTGQMARLESAKIRGIQSAGMICSEKELGVSEGHSGFMILPSETPVGVPLSQCLSDIIFDLEVTPNRADCLNIIGIARELAALTNQSVRLPDAEYNEAGPVINEQIAVEIKSPELCPRYSASLIRGIKIGESPEWMQKRLIACGMRPINNVVDITNYVMLEYGQPLHAFDYDRVKDKRIIVRRAGTGEQIVTLDGVERKLSADTLVIADAEGAVAIAGVMGGADSEVTAGTRAVLLESANFNPASIHYTARTLNLPSEASYRFERGISPELTMPALRRATQLILTLAGQEAAEGIVDVYPGQKTREPIPLAAEKVNRLLGVDFSMGQVTGALTSLGFDCQQGQSSSEILAKPPYWRTDINIPEDLVEEAARIIGYDKIPIALPGHRIPHHDTDKIVGFKQHVRESLKGFGFYEIVTYSMTGADSLNRLLLESHPFEPQPVRLVNPMTAEQEYMRPTLRANLLTILAANRKHEESGIRLFELGHVFLRKDRDLPDQREMLCSVISGPRLPQSWHGGEEQFDFFDAKGIVESLLAELHLESVFEKSHEESLHPHNQAAIVIEGSKLGVVGQVHPRVTESFGLDETLYLLEVDINKLLPFATVSRLFQPIPRFPPTTRDVALIVDQGITHQQVVNMVKSFPLVSRVALFDVYTGEQVPAGKKSLAYRIIFQSPTHTLTDEEVDRVFRQMVQKLADELGATLRSQ